MTMPIIIWTARLGPANKDSNKWGQKRCLAPHFMTDCKPCEEQRGPTPTSCPIITHTMHHEHKCAHE